MFAGAIVLQDDRLMIAKAKCTVCWRTYHFVDNTGNCSALFRSAEYPIKLHQLIRYR